MKKRGRVILSIGFTHITGNSRISVAQVGDNTVVLKIRDVRMSDESWYSCESPRGIKQMGYLKVVDAGDYGIPSVSISRERIPVALGKEVTIYCNIYFTGNSDIYWTFPNGTKVMKGLTYELHLRSLAEEPCALNSRHEVQSAIVANDWREERVNTDNPCHRRRRPHDLHMCGKKLGWNIFRFCDPRGNWYLYCFVRPYCFFLFVITGAFHFPEVPTLEISKVRGILGEDVEMTCKITSNIPTIGYWMLNDNQAITTGGWLYSYFWSKFRFHNLSISGDRYLVGSVDRENVSIITLSIKAFNADDRGTYSCIATNSQYTTSSKVDMQIEGKLRGISGDKSASFDATVMTRCSDLSWIFQRTRYHQKWPISRSQTLCLLARRCDCSAPWFRSRRPSSRSPTAQQREL